ncbi:MAG: NAD(P)H-hydrate epimerase [Candidatus Brocadiia bacterium]
MPDQFAVTRQQIRELDRIAIEDYGIPGLILMENAGRACAETACEMLGDAEGGSVALLCGRGNNGGDGFVVARHLANRGVRVTVILLAQAEDVLDRGGETAINLRIIRRMGLRMEEVDCREAAAEAVAAHAGADLLVDALLGTGISGEVREPFRAAIEALNESGAPVLAVDVPSGLDCDTGEPMGVAVRAARTVTFAVNKIGLTRPAAARWTGQVRVAEISIPRAVIEEKAAQWQTEAE